MYAVRRWCVRHARLLETVYAGVERLFMALHPLWQRIGYDRVDKPVAFVERHVKGFLFDCRMCGKCILSSTGMSCPMNCPKQLRNGPCGGVRADGGCEVIPSMRCVWIEAETGSRRMRKGHTIAIVQPPVDRSREGTSAWLREVREKRDLSFATGS